MTDRTLNVVQVGTMLVSTSCGIGFLLGTGELAVHHGMASCLYAVSTALGLVLLGAYAPALWVSGHSVWSRFNLVYGSFVGRNVALLSLVWMTGVLAAQIRGGSAVLALTGLPRTSAIVLIIVLLVALSLVRLSWLSASFAFCLLACNLLLVHSLMLAGGFRVWLHAPVTFAKAIQHSDPSHVEFIFVSVAVMVVCGADYQQFAIAARKPSTARAGCLFAALLVFVMGFLPASAAIASGISENWREVVDPVQTVPVLLIRSISGAAAALGRDLIVGVLVTTALGSASSILRAMSDAAAMLAPTSIARPVWSRALPILLSTLVALRQQSLVDMMVELNVVYIAAVGPLIGLSVFRIRISDGAANAAMAIACAISLGGYVIRWTTYASLPEAIPLAASVGAALAVAALSSLCPMATPPIRATQTDPSSRDHEPPDNRSGSSDADGC